jgi:heterodisulfide reductase subunit A
MYATKEAILIKEHEPSSNVAIFYMDLKTFGKGFQGFVDRAQSHWGVKYIRGRPGEIREDPTTRNLTIFYENTEVGRVEKLEAELVVLCTAAVPNRENTKLASVLGIRQDEYGFFTNSDPVISPVETDRPGIYFCGSCHGPRDIPESVTEASATAAKAAEDAAKMEVAV